MDKSKVTFWFFVQTYHIWKTGSGKFTFDRPAVTTENSFIWDPGNSWIGSNEEANKLVRNATKRHVLGIRSILVDFEIASHMSHKGLGSRDTNGLANEEKM